VPPSTVVVGATLVVARGRPQGPPLQGAHAGTKIANNHMFISEPNGANR
jgi:hypothetical protein